MKKTLYSVLLILLASSVVKSQACLFSDAFERGEITKYIANRPQPWDSYVESYVIKNRPLENSRDTTLYERYNYYGQLAYIVEKNPFGVLYYEGKVLYPDTISLYIDYLFDTELSVRHRFYYIFEYSTDTVLSYYDDQNKRNVPKFKESSTGTYDIETKIKLINNRHGMIVRYYDINDGSRLLFTREYQYKKGPGVYSRFYFVSPQTSK